MENLHRAILTACVVHLCLILVVQSENQMADQFVVKNNNMGENYFKVLQKGLTREQKAFSTMREQLQFAQFRNTDYTRQNFKKNTHETKRDIPSTMTLKAETLGGHDKSLFRMCLQKKNMSMDTDMEKLGMVELREMIQCMDRHYKTVHEDKLQNDILPYMSWKFNYSQWCWDDPENNIPDFSKVSFDDAFDLGEQGLLNWINNTKIWGRILSSRLEGPREMKQKLLTAFPSLTTAHVAQYLGLAVTLVHKTDARQGMYKPDDDLTRILDTNVLIEALSQWQYFNDPDLLKCIKIFEGVTNKNRWN